MKNLYYTRDVHTYVAEGCIPIDKIVYVESASDGVRTHVTLSTGEVLTIDHDITHVTKVLDTFELREWGY